MFNIEKSSNKGKESDKLNSERIAIAADQFSGITLLDIYDMDWFAKQKRKLKNLICDLRIDFSSISAPNFVL